jgi:hypothetical protein
MAPNQFLTEKEKQTKKGWLILLFSGILINAAVWFGIVRSQEMPQIPLVFRILGLGVGVAFAYLYYALCYRRTTTFLLTFSLVSFWLALACNAILLFKGLLPWDPFLGITLVTGALNYFFTWRLRGLNKALKGYAKFPEESGDAAAIMQSAVSQSELEIFYSAGLKKWPHLKWVLKRERGIRKDFLASEVCIQAT